MDIITNKASLQKAVKVFKDQGLTIGFVPTMGGLHQGHLSLVRKCKSVCDVCVVSLFLNPTQFNNPEDFQTYPYDTAEDLELLTPEGVDIVFVPSVQEMYQEGEQPPNYNLGTVAQVMEGAHRPGHFQGVVWIVSKLFKLVQPHKAFFGEKDFQQIAVINKMVELDNDIHVQIVPCPIVREPDGLAMSSRNRRLTPAQRAIAPRIYKALQRGVEWAKQYPPQDVVSLVTNEIEENKELRVEYFEIVDATTLLPVNNWSEAASIAGCIAVFCGPVRLIDHIHF